MGLLSPLEIGIGNDRMKWPETRLLLPDPVTFARGCWWFKMIAPKCRTSYSVSRAIGIASPEVGGLHSSAGMVLFNGR
jgi:hypothetical protein